MSEILLQELREREQKEINNLIKEFGKIRIDKKIYCKYCYKDVKPQINYFEGLIQCCECNYGLAQLKDVIKAGSYKKYRDKIELRFLRKNNYLDAIRNKTIKPTGKDEFGFVEGICSTCKEREITIYTNQGDSCSVCFKTKSGDKNVGLQN